VENVATMVVAETAVVAMTDLTWVVVMMTAVMTAMATALLTVTAAMVTATAAMKTALRISCSQ
jgi:hypothetical protein